MQGFRVLKGTERVVYACLCGAWLYAYFSPMKQLGLINRPETFLLPVAILVLSGMFRWWWVRILGGFVASLFYIDIYWRAQDDSIWLGLWHISKLLLSQIWPSIHTETFVDPLQTFIFIWVIALVFWLVMYASYRSRLWLFYNILGVAVLAAVDSNTNAHPNASLVVVSVICVFVLGMNQLQQIRALAARDFHVTRRFLSALLVLLVICGVVTVAAPKQVAAWPNPFGESTGGGSGATKTIGYQLDNSQLGGSFVANSDEVLTVISPTPTYLRGQTLSTYTGKGWKLAPLTDAQMLQQSIGVPFSHLSLYDFSGLPTKKVTQTIELQSNHVNTSDLLGGYAISTIEKLPGSYDNQVAIDMVQGNIRGPHLKNGQSYQIQMLDLVQPYDKLAAIHTPFSEERTAIPDTVRQFDAELPGTLPSDVGNLARSIVEQSHAVTEYQMVTAIQNYLKANYTYQTTDVPVPGKNQDYVAQFLFDSKRGYCNNFSSAMAVMLRTLGIPTRWVTGFADGTQDYNYSSKTNNKYIVTNDDAHSWVEVYFPKYGFVPFDPTPNFEIPFAQAGSTSSSPASSSTTNSSKTPTPPVRKPPAQSSGSSSQQVPVGTGGTVGKWIGLLAGLIVLLLVALLLLRSQISMLVLAWMWKRDPRRALMRAHQRFTSELSKQNGQRVSTMRELWPLVHDEGITQGEYRDWVQAFEGVLYGGDTLTDDMAIRLKLTTLRWLRILHRNQVERRGWRIWK